MAPAAQLSRIELEMTTLDPSGAWSCACKAQMANCVRLVPPSTKKRHENHDLNGLSGVPTNSNALPRLDQGEKNEVQDHDPARRHHNVPSICAIGQPAEWPLKGKFAEFQGHDRIAHQCGWYGVAGKEELQQSDQARPHHAVYETANRSHRRGAPQRKEASLRRLGQRRCLGTRQADRDQRQQKSALSSMIKVGFKTSSMDNNS